MAQGPVGGDSRDGRASTSRGGRRVGGAGAKPWVRSGGPGRPHAGDGRVRSTLKPTVQDKLRRRRYLTTAGQSSLKERGRSNPRSCSGSSLCWFSACSGRVEVGGGVKERPVGRPRQRP